MNCVVRGYVKCTGPDCPSPTHLYKLQGPQHDFCEESSQAMTTFRKQASIGEEILSHNQLLGTKDKDEVSALCTNEPG